jgi:hypothetical protein
MKSYKLMKNRTNKESRGWSKDEIERPFSVLVLGWLEPDIIKRSLNSINELVGVDPRIYFIEQKSKNSDIIKELILSTSNIKGYIQMKENWAAASWKIAMEHFLPQIEDEFITITDGDYVWDSFSMDYQYNKLEAHSDIGIISQKRSLLGMAGHWKSMVMKGYSTAVKPDERNAEAAWADEGMTRSNFNGMNLTTARKKDWEEYVDVINTKRVSFATSRIGEPWIPEHRPPLFWDVDLYPFFENVFNKSSFVVEKGLSYHIADEYENDPESQYSIEKRECGYHSHWRDYQDDPDFYHSRFYKNGDLKYDIIK